MKKNVALCVSHSLFLTRKQRYDLHGGKTLKIIGASMPVWFCRGSTSEPAEEVFCKYTIHNKKGDSFIRRTKNNTYIINLPQLPENYQKLTLSDEDWRKLTEKERSAWYETNPEPLSSIKLLDLKDGGCEMLSFKLQQDLENVTIIHLVLIKRMEDLMQSLIAS